MIKTNRPILFLLVLCAFLAGCSSPAARPATQPAGATLTPELAASTATPAASPTPLASKVLLVASGEADLQSTATALSGKSGLTVVSQPALQKSDLTPEVKIVLLAAPPADLSDLLTSAPQVQFVVISGVDLPAANNLTVIRTRAETQAFVAGFMSVLLSTDFRAAGLLPTDGSLGAGLKEAFENGGHYFCGVCAPGWPLNIYYPVVGEQPSAADGPTWQASAASLFDNQKVEVFYLDPAAVHPEVTAYLQGRAQGDKTVVVLGATPPPDELKPQWAGSVHFDLTEALEQVWPDTVAGKGGAIRDAPLVVDNVNSDLLSPGKMRLVNNLIEQLKAGQVLPDSIPAQ